MAREDIVLGEGTFEFAINQRTATSNGKTHSNVFGERVEKIEKY